MLYKNIKENNLEIELHKNPEVLCKSQFLYHYILYALKCVLRGSI